MIEANKSPWFSRWFSGHAKKRLRATFSAVRVRGLGTIQRALSSGPVLVVSNHTAWWDPIVALFLAERVLGADAYAMMDAKNLRTLPFFGRVGAFGVDLADPADGARAIRYAVKRLTRPGDLVWIFPQGKEVPVTARPLGFEAGSGAVARLARRATVIPIAIRYEHGSVPEASVWISIGAPASPGATAKSSAEAQERAVESELEAIERALVGVEASAFEAILAKRPSALDALATKLLAWLTRPRRLARRTDG